MNHPALLHLPQHPETTEETPEIPPGLSRAEVRRRLSFGASSLVVDPGAVAAAWLMPFDVPSAALGEA